MQDALPSPSHAGRRRWMAVLARTDAAAMQSALADRDVPPYTRLRGPQTGLVMARGRAGGAGAAFNLGEVAVTRCTVRTASGEVGHAYALGRDLRRAELAAVFDALLQDPARAAALLPIIDGWAEEQAALVSLTARRAAATGVQFFTMATMRS